MSTILQNFYKSTITIDWTIGTGNFYVAVKPTTSAGWLVVSPNNAATREIVRYTATGTDGNGDYITVSSRGVGGTTQQTHSIGEPVRMNITAEHWADMQADIDSIVAAGVANATTTSMGGVELATGSEVTAGTDTSGTGTPLVVQPSQLNSRIITLSNSVIPTTNVFTASGIWTKPAGLKYVIVEVQGAGGGGGGTTNTDEQASGGGAGGYGKKTIAAASLGVTETVTVGAGGNGSSTNSVATTGGTSSFGSHISCTGGAGGIAGGDGSVGGTSTGGDINMSGGGGSSGVYNSTSSDLSGFGGHSFYGRGGYATTGTQSGINANGYGAGGGGVATSTSADQSGGNGANGIVIVTNFF